MNTNNRFQLQSQPLFGYDQEGTMQAGYFGCPETSTLTTATTVSDGCCAASNSCPTG